MTCRVSPPNTTRLYYEAVTDTLWLLVTNSAGSQRTVSTNILVPAQISQSRSVLATVGFDVQSTPMSPCHTLNILPDGVRSSGSSSGAVMAVASASMRTVR